MFITDKYLANYNLKVLLILFVFSNLIGTISCQTRETSVDSITKSCQKLLDKDDVIAASECFLKASLGNPYKAKEISEAGQTAVFKKCVEFKKQEQYEESIICIEGLTEAIPNSYNIFFQLGGSYYQYYLQILNKSGRKDMKLLDKADKAMQRSIQINSEVALVRETYGIILTERGYFEDALEEHLYAVKLRPKSIRMLIELARIQEKTGIDNDAIVSYLKVLEIDSNNTLALYFIGKLYEKTNQIDRAIESYEKLLKIKPSYDDAEQRLENLKQKGKKIT